ncbi:LLM class flavin-dependent oxidoreductase [Shimazuella kribbensis]|uniref:LLM class flavin-dependent oxidoreductase n=1 Tax=Shimazuella kribbensis TaxID=139808 RepID=UPI000401A435|nr:LLM class flavin-dependent oxidoreductase [Shimazuella kribbensis]
MVHLSILDQSPVVEGKTEAEALMETSQLAQEADKLGYTRFWVSEHHAMKAMAGSSPEVLVSHLASVTSRIRVGSGGIMIPHYSSFKVAENFQVLEALYPDRIDLGIGRASGGLSLASKALQEGKTEIIPYHQQIIDLMHYLYGSFSKNHRFSRLQVTPSVLSAPPIWLLGSSMESAHLAARLGIPYAYAHFLSYHADPTIMKRYTQLYQTSVICDQPKTLIALFVICGETEKEAEEMTSTLDLTFLLSEQNPYISRVPSKKTVKSYPYSDQDFLRMKNNRSRIIVGNPKSVRDQILEIGETFGTDEFMILTITHDFKSKLKSYQLLSEAFHLVSN